MDIESGIIPRVAFNLLGVDIYWYAIIITFAICVGYVWARIRNGKFGIRFETCLDLSLFMIPIAIICARAYYVIFKWDYYSNNPAQILNFRNGGIAIYGALIGAIITIIIFCKTKKVNILDLLDYLAPIIPLCQAIGRWGNYINVEAYGTETNGFIRMKILENGVTKFVHPTFLYESFGNLLLFIVLVYLCKKRKFSGEIACVYLTGYAIIRFFVEGLRTDSLMLWNFRVSQLLSFVIFVCGFIIYFLKMKKISKVKALNQINHITK